MAIDCALPIQFEISVHEGPKGLAPYIVKVEHRARTHQVSVEEVPVHLSPDAEDQVPKFIFSNYGRTRRQPSTVDDAYLDKFLKKSARDIAKLHGRMRSVYTNIQQLCIQAAEISSTVLRKQHLAETARSFRAPIRRVPPEVLSMIFSMYRGPNLCDNRSGRLLSQVSRMFREVALSTPSLWDSHRLDLGDLHNRSPSNSASFLRLIKDRASGRRLSLDIVERARSYPEYSDHSRVRALLRSSSFALPMLTTLRLDVTFLTLASAFSSFGKETGPTFDSLELLTLRIRKPTRDATTLTMFSNCPKLRAASLYLEQFDRFDAAIHLPSMPLRVFDYQATYDGDEMYGDYMVPWRESIQGCSALEQLNLSFVYHPDFDEYLADPPFLDDESSESQIALPQLQTIKVVNELSGRVRSIFSKLKVTENLKTLRFEAKSQPCIIASDDENLFPKMFCALSDLSVILYSLTSLSLIHVVISDDDLPRLFDMTPNLTHLEILNIAEWHEIDRRAAYRRPDNERLVEILRDSDLSLPGAILPRLVSLVLYVPDQRNDSFEATVKDYVTMAKKRAEWNASRNVSSTESKNHFEIHLHFFEESVKGHTDDNIDMLQFEMEMTKINTDSCRFQYTYDVLERFINSGCRPGEGLCGASIDG
ncbi:hypothetical protein M413DRAFT_23020 [Hebeloma cylindrosporum]|uniref:Uncharacterized protein n=1 Tax=Hebeloma cylindrosporum TaxID=76867 RepID=A0A0C2YA01_HEBCY|nr:hypothetical protein M413DRAFT_23020 [Hebeloma cylindrosporum h7]